MHWIIWAKEKLFWRPDLDGKFHFNLKFEKTTQQVWWWFTVILLRKQIGSKEPHIHHVSPLMTKKFVDCRLRFVLRKQVRLGYLDVAIAKICKTCMQSCAIDLRQRLFKCSHREKKLSVKLVKNSIENIWSVKVGVHPFTMHRK